MSRRISRGTEVAGDDGEFIGTVRGVKVLRPASVYGRPARVALVRHDRGDGQTRAYELGEVSQYVAKGKPVAS